MIQFDCTVDWNLSSDDILRKFNLEPHGRVQTAIDNAVMRYAQPYWANETGTLSTSCYSATDVGSGIIVYPGPYAHYMYKGIVYGPNFPVEFDSEGNVLQWRSPKGKKKHATNRRLKYRGARGGTDTIRGTGPGSNPINRMKDDHMNDIVEEARRIVRDEQR